MTRPRGQTSPSVSTDRLTGRNAEIIYEFEDMTVDVPSGTGDDAEHAHWRLDGTMRITTREQD